MNVKNKLTLFIFVVLFFSCSKNQKDILANVNGDVISLSKFKNSYQDFLIHNYQNDNLSSRYAYLNNLIDEKLILEYAKDNKLENDSSYIQKTQEVYDQLLLNNYFDKKINLDLSVTEAESRSVFQWGKTAIHVRHLFAKNINQINDIKSRLDRGESWNILAEDCFQDSILRINGGDLGWYNQGELDPVFEWNAFSLKIGEISNPVRTRDGYSIIHLDETEYDGFIIEDEYQKKKKKLFDLVRNYKQQTRLLQFTDSTISTMDIEFNETVLDDLYNFLLSVGNENFEKIQNDKLISFEDEEWDVSESLNKLSNLSPDQLSRIKSISDLKQTIIGLTCRSKFLVDAVANKIYETKPFKDNLSKQLDQTMIKKVVTNLNKKLNNDKVQDQKKIIENYFNFRKELILTSNVKVDSLLLKTFIM